MRKLGQGHRTDITSQKIPAELHDRLIDACDRFGQKKSEVIRRAIAFYLDSLENQKPSEVA